MPCAWACPAASISPACRRARCSTAPCASSWHPVGLSSSSCSDWGRSRAGQSGSWCGDRHIHLQTASCMSAGFCASNASSFACLLLCITHNTCAVFAGCITSLAGLLLSFALNEFSAPAPKRTQSEALDPSVRAVAHFSGWLRGRLADCLRQGLQQAQCMLCMLSVSLSLTVQHIIIAARSSAPNRCTASAATRQQRWSSPPPLKCRSWAPAAAAAAPK